MWTRFMDMHSGGGLKEGDYSYIFIEAPIEEAKVVFYNRFGHSPDRVTCTCCGNDYSIDEHPTLEQATAYDRGCRYDDKKKKYVEEKNTGKLSFGRKYVTLKAAIAKGTFDGVIGGGKFLLIRKNEIKPEERKGEVPEQGYVWHD